MANRNHRITIYLTLEEKQRAERTAEKMGFAVGSYARCLLLQEPRVISIQQNGTKRRRW